MILSSTLGSSPRAGFFRIMLWRREKQERNALPFRCVVILRIVFLFASQDFLGNQAGVLTNRGFDLGSDIGISFEKGLGVLAALTDALAVIREPGAGLFHDTGFHAKIDQFTHLGNALA